MRSCIIIPVLNVVVSGCSKVDLLTSGFVVSKRSEVIVQPSGVVISARSTVVESIDCCVVVTSGDSGIVVWIKAAIVVSTDPCQLRHWLWSWFSPWHWYSTCYITRTL